MARKKMARKRKPQVPSPETIKLARGFAQKHNVLSNSGRWKGLVPEVSDDLLGADGAASPAHSNADGGRAVRRSAA